MGTSMELKLVMYNSTPVILLKRPTESRITRGWFYHREKLILPVNSRPSKGKAETLKI